jgi:hypothetical protein
VRFSDSFTLCQADRYPAASIRGKVGYISRAVAHGLAITPNSAKKRAANGPCGSTLACIPGNGTNDSLFMANY